MKRTSDWIRQAEKDLKHARHALRDDDFEWSCFSAQQSAEKAVKGLFQALRIDAWGHSVSRLLVQLPQQHACDADLVDVAKELDKCYIPTRYPNFHPEGAPMDYYTKNEAQRAIHYAEQILKFCTDKITKIG